VSIVDTDKMGFSGVFDFGKNKTKMRTEIKTKMIRRCKGLNLGIKLFFRRKSF
jgi:hypothetical protein